MSCSQWSPAAHLAAGTIRSLLRANTWNWGQTLLAPDLWHENSTSCKIVQWTAAKFTEIRQFKLSNLTDQQVLRLKITMKDMSLVTKVEAAEQLEKE